MAKIPMKNYVVTGVARFEFQAASWGDAERVAKHKLKETGVSMHDVLLTCETTGDEEPLQV